MKKSCVLIIICLCLFVKNSKSQIELDKANVYYIKNNIQTVIPITINSIKSNRHTILFTIFNKEKLDSIISAFRHSIPIKRKSINMDVRLFCIIYYKKSNIPIEISVDKSGIIQFNKKLFYANKKFMDLLLNNCVIDELNKN